MSVSMDDNFVIHTCTMATVHQLLFIVGTNRNVLISNFDNYSSNSIVSDD